MSLPNFSFEGLLSSSKSGALGLSTGGSREFDDQRKKMGLDFDLRKTCAKFILKYYLKSGGQKHPKRPLLGMPDLSEKVDDFGEKKVILKKKKKLVKN